MTSSDASTGWESGDSTATDRPPEAWWSADYADVSDYGLFVNYQGDQVFALRPAEMLPNLPADAVRLIPIDATEADIVGSRIVSLLGQGNDLNARVTRERDEARAQRDEALGRICVAEQVQTRMAMSLPDHGPWQAWSERDRAVRDYEGDLSTALATETNLVAELRAQRDAALRLHASAKNYTGCRACYRDWPCPTARALGVTDV